MVFALGFRASAVWLHLSQHVALALHGLELRGMAGIQDCKTDMSRKVHVEEACWAQRQAKSVFQVTHSIACVHG